MKHISSKLILLTISLTVGLLLTTAILSFSILKKESRSYTFQGQLLKAQLFSENLKSELIRTNEITSGLFNLNPFSKQINQDLANYYTIQKNLFEGLEGVGIRLEGNATTPPQWIEYPERSVSSVALPMNAVEKTFVPAERGGTDFVAFVPGRNGSVAIRLDLKKQLWRCVGTNMVIYDGAGKPIFYCNPNAKALFEKAGPAIKEIYGLSLESGTLERKFGEDSLLLTYADFLNFGKVISATTANAAYRPAYALAARVVLLILMAIGAVIVISILVGKRLSSPIEQVTLATQKIAQGDFDTAINIGTRDETKTLATSVESMAQKIKKLLHTEVEKAKLDAQLEVAGTVQRTLIPDRKIDLGTVRINSYYRPADQCGGDWWGYVMNGQGKVAVMIGDVSGHGYASALLVATTRGFLSMLQDRIERDQGRMPPPDDILKSLNVTVFDATRGELNMTAMCMVLDLNTGAYEVSSAGHNAAYIIDGSNEISVIRAEGSRLGETQILTEALQKVEGVLAAHGKIVLYTDGIQDLGPEDHPLGRKGFRTFIQHHVGASAEDLVHAVETELFPLNEGRPLQDDLTFVVLERNA